MTIAVPTWIEIAAGRTGDDAAAVALSRLREAAWLANLGHPSNRDHEAVRVDGWPEALRMFTEGISRAHRPTHGTGTTGTLNGPFWLLLRQLDTGDLERITADAANHALDTLPDDYYSVGNVPLPPDADAFDTEIAVGDYVHEFIRLLFIEIYAGDGASPRCTYFRDQLGWFLAGFLPCGWEGEWPHGRMRVF